jgi:hypothetical protein
LGKAEKKEQVGSRRVRSGKTKKKFVRKEVEKGTNTKRSGLREKEVKIAWTNGKWKRME